MHRCERRRCRECSAVQLVGARVFRASSSLLSSSEKGADRCSSTWSVFQQSPPEQHPPHPARCQTSGRCRDHPWLWRLAHSPAGRAGGGNTFTGAGLLDQRLLTTAGCACWRPSGGRRARRSRDRCCCLALLGDGHGVLVLAVDAELKVQVRPGGPARGAHGTHGLALFYRLAIRTSMRLRWAYTVTCWLRCLTKTTLPKPFCTPANSTTPSPTVRTGVPVGLQSRCPGGRARFSGWGASAS
jgi:hypothetical protein